MIPAVDTEFEVVIGLEVHAQVTTSSKMFCRCSTDYSGAEPNTHVCPVCLGMPGVLPSINIGAVEATIKTGLALNCEVPERAKFDRKNYPYPDLMKGYQISEYDMPLCRNGYMDVQVDGVSRRIRINRVHLEEDTARLLHRSDETGETYSLVDVNRAGMPLMEIVTEPDARSPAEAIAYLTKLRQILRYIGVSDADMEAGNFRVEPNLSLRPKGTETLGAKVELKNLNSFRAAQRAMEFEVQRQTRLLSEGEKVDSETRGWREETGETVSQRSKEQAHDYRYFPEPDLPPMAVSAEWVEELRHNLPELPDARRARFLSEYGLSPYEANLLTESKARADFFERTLALIESGEEGLETRAKFLSNWTLGDLARLLNESDMDSDDPRLKLTPESFAKLLNLVRAASITSSVGKQVLRIAFETGQDPESIVVERGLRSLEDSEEIAAIVSTVIADNPKAALDYKSGNTRALNSLLGQVMSRTGGRANAREVQKLLQTELDRPSY